MQCHQPSNTKGEERLTHAGVSVHLLCPLVNVIILKQVPFFRDNLRAHGSNQGSPFSGHAWQERIILRKVITPAVIQNPTNKHCRPRFFGHELKIHFRLRLLYLWVWIWSSGLFGYSLILAFCNVNSILIVGFD